MWEHIILDVAVPYGVRQHMEVMGINVLQEGAVSKYTKSQNQKTQIKSAGSSINVRIEKMSLQNMAVMNVQAKKMGAQGTILPCAIRVNTV
jgi:hypothetical protein